MTEKIPRIHFDYDDPRIEEMTNLISSAGFRPLTSATPVSLPVGAVVLIYNSTNHMLFPIVVYQHHFKGFSYMLFDHLDKMPCVCNMDSTHDFEKHMYKVICTLPKESCCPNEENFKRVFSEMGFKSLDEASSEDLPQGCIALVSYNGNTIWPVIVRTLSTINRRLLYFDQSAIVAGDWYPSVIMDELKTFGNYSYWVLS